MTTYTPQQINCMREWITDCYWQDLEDVSDLTDNEVINGVRRHYDGGIEQFLIDSTPVNFKP